MRSIAQTDMAGAACGVLRAAVAAGVDHIDTAQYYGVVNDLIREALYPYAVACLPGELSQHPT